MKSSNPVFGNNVYDVSAEHVGYGQGMTIAGTVNKAGILMILVMLSAAWTWNQFFNAVGAVAAGEYPASGIRGSRSCSGLSAPPPALVPPLRTPPIDQCGGQSRSIFRKSGYRFSAENATNQRSRIAFRSLDRKPN